MPVGGDYEKSWSDLCLCNTRKYVEKLTIMTFDETWFNYGNLGRSIFMVFFFMYSISFCYALLNHMQKNPLVMYICSFTLCLYQAVELCDYVELILARQNNNWWKRRATKTHFAHCMSVVRLLDVAWFSGLCSTDLQLECPTFRLRFAQSVYLAAGDNPTSRWGPEAFFISLCCSGPSKVFLGLCFRELQVQSMKLGAWKSWF